MGYPTSPLRGIFVLSLLSVAVSGAVQAETAANQEIEEIIVRAHPLSAEGLAPSQSLIALVGRNSTRRTRRSFVQLWPSCG
jgi:hypothetical protein